MTRQVTEETERMTDAQTMDACNGIPRVAIMVLDCEDLHDVLSDEVRGWGMVKVLKYALVETNNASD